MADPRKIAAYISDPGVTPEMQEEIQHIFDTHRIHPDEAPTPGYISFVPGPSWAFGRNPTEIMYRHLEENSRSPSQQYFDGFVVILDAQTVLDSTVVIVSDDPQPKAVRIIPQWVWTVVRNVEFMDMTFYELGDHLDDDGVFREWNLESDDEDDDMPVD